MRHLRSIVLSLSLAILAQSPVSAETWGEKWNSVVDRVGPMKDALSIEPPDILASLSPDQAFELAARQFEGFSSQIADLTPTLEALGFQMSTFRVQLLPPTGKLRLISSRKADLEVDTVSAPELETLFSKSLFYAAKTAKRIQNSMDLEMVIMDVTVGLNPTIKLSYLDEADLNAASSTPFQDIDLLCGQAL